MSKDRPVPNEVIFEKENDPEEMFLAETGTEDRRKPADDYGR